MSLYKDLNERVGSCVIPCAFLDKVLNIHFLVAMCILFKKNMFPIFFVLF